MKNPNRAYIILLVCILVIIILLGVLIYGILTKLRQASFDVAKDRSEVAYMQLQDKQVGNFKTKYQDYKTNLDKVDQLFVDAENPVDFIRFLENIAVLANVNSNIAIGAHTKTPDAAKQKSITFQIYASGSFKGILQFSQQLEMSPYLVGVTNFNIKKLDRGALAKDAPQGDLEADISLEALSK